MVGNFKKEKKIQLTGDDEDSRKITARIALQHALHVLSVIRQSLSNSCAVSFLGGGGGRRKGRCFAVVSDTATNFVSPVLGRGAANEI